MVVFRDRTPAADSLSAALERTVLEGCQDIGRIDIDAILAPGEPVLLALPGLAGEDTEVLVVTPTRVLRLGRRSLRRDVHDEVPAHAVRGVSYRPGVFAKVAVTVAGRGPIAFSPRDSDDAARFAYEFDHLMRTGHLPEPREWTQGTWADYFAATSPGAASYRDALERNKVAQCRDLRRIDVEKTLEHGERVLLALPIRYFGSMPEVLLLTTARALRLGDRLVRRDLIEEAPAHAVIGADFHPVRFGVFPHHRASSRLSIHLRDGGEIGGQPVDIDDAMRFAEEARHLVRTGRVPGEG